MHHHKRPLRCLPASNHPRGNAPTASCLPYISPRAATWPHDCPAASIWPFPSAIAEYPAIVPWDLVPAATPAGTARRPPDRAEVLPHSPRYRRRTSHRLSVCSARVSHTLDSSRSGPARSVHLLTGHVPSADSKSRCRANRPFRTGPLGLLLTPLAEYSPPVLPATPLDTVSHHRPVSRREPASPPFPPRQRFPPPRGPAPADGGCLFHPWCPASVSVSPRLQG